MSTTASEYELSESVLANQGTTLELNASFESRKSADADRNANWISLSQLKSEEQQKTKDLCRQWVNLYMATPKSALANFIQLVLEASGNNYRISEGIQLPFNFTDLLVTATAYFGNKGISYPLVMKNGPSFTKTLSGFQHLMRYVAETTIILDDFFLNNISCFMMTFSNSKVRAFRHTSTLIALKIMTSLGTLFNLENEKLKYMWLQLFENIFLKRCRDVVDDIRYICISECCTWLERYPHCFLNVVHLKYIFLALKDKSQKVCECSLQAIERLYSSPMLHSACLELGEQYRMILCDLTSSLEAEVARMAIKLLIKLYWEKSDVLDEFIIDVIEQLVFAANRGVAQAAAELIPFRYKLATSEEQRVLALVRFFLQFPEHEHAAYLVDALYGNNEIVLAWSTMVEMLSEPVALSAEESSALIEILARSVHQAVTGEIPAGRYTKDLVRQPQPDASKMATEVLLNKLPTFLRQYRSRSEDLVNLLKLTKHLTLVKPMLPTLLNQIENIMFEQENFNVLRMGAKTLEYLYGLDEDLEKQRKKLLNNAITNLKIAENNWKKSKNKSPNDKRLVVTLQLVATLSHHFDLSEWNLSGPVMRTLKRAMGFEGEAIEASLSAMALKLYLKIYNVGIYWSLFQIRGLAASGEDVARDCATLRERVHAVLPVCFYLIQQSTDKSLGHMVFKYICEIFVLFSDSISLQNNTAMLNLEYKSTENEREVLEKYLLQHVFNNKDADAVVKHMEAELFKEKLNRRRLLISYMKLFFHNVIPMMPACKVFQYYEEFYPVFGDIMRATLERCLIINCTNFGMTIMHTCLLVFKRIRLTYKDALKAAESAEFSNLLKLAKLLSEVFNDKLHIRPGILVLHRAGILFAGKHLPEDSTGPPKDLLYLTVLEQFVPQLLAQDMLDVLNSLKLIEKEALPGTRAEDWQPFLSYRSCLELAISKSCRRDELYDLPYFEEQDNNIQE